jgi:hypothetical protein
MAHPFEKMFERALKKCDGDFEIVLDEAVKLRDKGYSHTEILAVLTKLQKSLIDDKEAEIVGGAIDAFEDEQ